MRPLIFLKWAAGVFIGAVLFASCAKEELAVNDVNDAVVLEQRFSGIQTLFEDWQSGNAEFECAEAGGGCGYAWKIDDPYNGTFTTGIPDANITILNYNGTSFSWTSDLEICKVIVKGGPSAYVYDYGTGTCGDDLLLSPPNPKNKNGKHYGISHITFCYTDVSCLGQTCYQEETAWGEGERYVAQGNWAMYTPYSGGTTTVDILAGQYMLAGSATLFSLNPNEVKIIISLNGWEFANVPENIKVQDYGTPPSGNPAPGTFAHKTTAIGSVWEIIVPYNNFYGIHLDVVHEVPCP